MQTKTIKQLAIGVLSAVASFFLWKSVAQITLHGGYAHLLPWVGFVLLLAAAEGLLFLLALGRNAWMVWLFSVIHAALLLVAFGHENSSLIAAGLFALAGGVMTAFPSSIEKSASGAYHHAAYRLAWPFALVLLGFTAFLSTSLLTPQSIATTVTNYGFPYIASNIAPFNSDQTVDDYLTTQIVQGGIVSQATPALLAEGRKGLSEQIGEPVTGNEKLSDIGKQFISSKVESALVAAGFNSGNWYYLFVLLLIVLPVVRLVIAAGSDVLIILGESVDVVTTSEKQISVTTFDL
jgi:hypothetical protein